MRYLSSSLIYVGIYHLVSSLVLYSLIRLFSYQELQNQYSLGGIDAVFTITENNYHFGIIISLIFATTAIFEGLALKYAEGKLSTTRSLLNGILVLVVGVSAIYFSFINLLILINPGYF